MFASEWNARYPKGTKVKYWPRGKNSHDKPVETEVRRAAYYLGSGTLIVPLANGRNAKLTEIEPVMAQQASPDVIAPGTYISISGGGGGGGTGGYGQV